MTEIVETPKEVESRAFKLALEFRKSELKDGVQALALTNVIAGAIMAERMRCNKIAMSFVKYHESEGGTSCNPYASAISIAHEIRTRSDRK